MNTINNMPGFTADVSLYQTSGHYRTGRPTQMISAIYPAARPLGVGETTCDTYCCGVCSCCANKADQTCCANCGSTCDKNVAMGGAGVFRA